MDKLLYLCHLCLPFPPQTPLKEGFDVQLNTSQTLNTVQDKNNNGRIAEEARYAQISVRSVFLEDVLFFLSAGEGEVGPSVEQLSVSPTSAAGNAHHPPPH